MVTVSCTVIINSYYLSRNVFKLLIEGFLHREVYLLLCIIALDQSHVLVNMTASPVSIPSRNMCLALAHDLLKLNKVYNSLGRIQSYRWKALDLLTNAEDSTNKDIEYLMQTFLDCE